jgi:hypothetical protein
VQGATGAQGTTGAQGATGAQGSQGNQGTTGAQGATGGIGPQGFQGAQGAQGAQGSAGAQGALGPQGLSGSNGAQGAQGAQGTGGSAGAQGAAGAQGPQGLQGPQGFQGAQGFQGVAGAQGPQGNQGFQGAMAGVVSRFSNNAAQAGPVPAGTNVVLNTTDANQASAFVTLSANQIILQPGTYELTGSIGGMDGSGANGRVLYAFFNVTDNVWIGQGGAVTSPNSTDPDGLYEGPAAAVITVAVPTTINLRVNTATGTITSISAQLDYATANLGRAWVQVVKF